MKDFEKLGVFYLGKEFDLDQNRIHENLILYDSKDLVTHGICIGMTGSGKTGLCISILEEAAMDNIPAIIIDPKGDMGNLLLTFPNLVKEEFLPWINADDARKKNVTAEDYAQQQSELWKKGLAQWGQDEQRIRKLREQTEFIIYTPGSNAGVPVSILKSFAAPEPVILEDSDALQEKINSTATSLLGLMDIDADPIKSKEHILIASILKYHWERKQNLDLALLIQEIQNPPISKVGVFDIESFYPQNERFQLAMVINNILAAPGFATWLEGEALDMNNLLYTESGKPKHSIFYLAHLSDAERMFFVALLLNQFVSWMRSRPGTTSLRTLLYFDEIFGYIPPVANPPSKAPLMTILKQGRAFGCGVLLATQNPADIDYKALSNAGTWFLGRLQTERDKARVLDGLYGIMSDQKEFDRLLSDLKSRVFLMHNVHEEKPVVFHTRWAMSYLRGPLTKLQIKTMMDGRKSMPKPAEISKSQEIKMKSKESVAKPNISSNITQVYLPIRNRKPENSTLTYHPKIVGFANIQSSSAREKIDTTIQLKRIFSFSDELHPINWDQFEELQIEEQELLRTAEGDASYSELPGFAFQEKNYSKWEKELINDIYRYHKVDLFKSVNLGLISNPGETERDFRIRLAEHFRTFRDDFIEKLRDNYAKKTKQIETKIRRAEERLDREKDQASGQKLQTAISFGSTLLGAFLGRKAVSRSSMSRATAAMRGVGRTMKEAEDVKRAEENLQFLRQELELLDQQFEQELNDFSEKNDPQDEELETISIRPQKSKIFVELFSLAWAPFWHSKESGLESAYQ